MMKRILLVGMALFLLITGVQASSKSQAASSKLTGQAQFKVIATQLSVKGSDDIYRVQAITKNGKIYNLRYNGKGNYSLVLAGIKKNDNITLKAYNSKAKLVKQLPLTVK